MPRVPRMVAMDSGQKTAYHVISRTLLDGLPFGKGNRARALYAPGGTETRGPALAHSGEVNPASPRDADRR